jgi:hypothetical protein
MVLSFVASLLLSVAVPGAAADERGGWQWKLQLTSAGMPISGDILERSPGSPPPSLQQFRSLEREPIASPPAGDRAFSPAEGQILIVALSPDNEIVWHKMFPDPRLIRAEVAGADGKLKGKKQFFRKMVEFSIRVPDDPAIDRVQLLQPHWTGRDFVLTALGTLAMR